MRWLLIDEFKTIRKGSHAHGIRNVTRSEEALAETHPSVPVMPSSFLLEMIAQVTGVLVGATIDFRKEVVLAKITDAEYTQDVWAPATLDVEGKLVNLDDNAACCEGTVHREGALVAKAVIFFGLFKHLDHAGQSAVFSRDFMESFAIRDVIQKSNPEPAPSSVKEPVR